MWELYLYNDNLYTWKDCLDIEKSFCVTCSPCSSRPPSPKSDTEFEMQKNDMGAQTQLTGNNFEDVDQVNWQWGQLPQSSGYKEDKLKSEKGERDASNCMSLS